MAGQLLSFDNQLLTSSWVILGIQYGDEGKGKLVDELINSLSKKHEDLYCVRFNGGSNAGHSIWIDNVLYDTHICPSGIVNPRCKNIIGCGVVVNPIQMFGEIKKLQSKGINTIDRIYISESSHVTLLIHKFVDFIEGKQFGSTGNGISQTMGDKANRRGMIMQMFKQNNWENKINEIYQYYKKHYLGYLDFLSEYKLKFNDILIEFSSVDEMFEFEVNFIKSKIHELKQMIVNTKYLLNDLDKDIPIIFEGANSIMLDPNVGYPNCTATQCTIGGLLIGAGISQKFLQSRNTQIVGVSKGYITRVGAGYLISESFDSDGEILQKQGNEFGTTTGRKRRTGWIDIPQLNFANMITGCDCINITKLDVLSKFKKIKVCWAYKNKITNVLYSRRNFDDTEANNYEPIYEEFDGWMNYDISQCLNYDDLHENIKKFINYIELKTNLPVKFINTGREQGQIIIKN